MESCKMCPSECNLTFVSQIFVESFKRGGNQGRKLASVERATNTLNADVLFNDNRLEGVISYVISLTLSLSLAYFRHIGTGTGIFLCTEISSICSHARGCSFAVEQRSLHQYDKSAPDGGRARQLCQWLDHCCSYPGWSF